MCKHLAALQIVALREQNAHLQRKVASGEGEDDLLEGEAPQKIHGKVSPEHKNMDAHACASDKRDPNANRREEPRLVRADAGISPSLGSNGGGRHYLPVL